MNDREGIAPIRTAYVRMKFWISERWRLITLLRGGMAAGLLLIIARCCVGIVIGEKEQNKDYSSLNHWTVLLRGVGTVPHLIFERVGLQIVI